MVGHDDGAEAHGEEHEGDHQGAHTNSNALNGAAVRSLAQVL